MRPLYRIAAEIETDWKNPYFAARPYLRAMHELTTFQDRYIMDDAEGIVLRFLGNAQTWRGPVARAIKAELKEGLAEFRKARKENEDA
jgi:hypothetical protein